MARELYNLVKTYLHRKAEKAAKVADLFCRNATRKVRKLFRELWANDDVGKYRVALGVLEGDQMWMEQLLEGLPATASQKPAKLATA